MKKIFDILPPKKQETKKPAAPKTISKKTQSNQKQEKLKKIVLVLVPILLFTAFIFFNLLTKAEIEIWPKTQTIFLEKEILIDAGVSKINLEKKILPGHFFVEEQEETKEFTCTGVLTKKEKAEGIIKVFNNYSLPQVLIANTRFLSAEGKLFYSQSYLNIGPGLSQEVKVVAAESGEEYNIKPTTFSIPGLLGSPRYTSVYGKSFSQMKGGTMVQVSQLSKNDIQSAENVVLNDLGLSSRQKLKERTEPFFVLLDQAVETKILEKSSSKNQGEEADKFDFYLKAQTKGLGFKKSDIETIVRQWAQEQTDSNYEIVAEGLNINYSVEDKDLENGKLFLKLNVSAKTFFKIDTEEMKQGLSDKTLEESKILLESYDGVEKTRIKIFPFWIKRIPENFERIRIKTIVDPVEKF